MYIIVSCLKKNASNSGEMYIIEPFDFVRSSFAYANNNNYYCLKKSHHLFYAIIVAASKNKVERHNCVVFKKNVLRIYESNGNHFAEKQKVPVQFDST